MTLYDILKEIKPSINKKDIKDNLDLVESGLLDSFELLELVHILEERYEFKYNDYFEKYGNFKIYNFKKFLKVKLF